MSAPREYRLPPIRAVLALVGVFAVLSHFSAVHHSEAYSNRISSLRSYLGLGSDGMPLSARVRLGHAAAGAGAAEVADDGGHSLAFVDEASVSRPRAQWCPVRSRHELALTSLYPRWPGRRAARQLDPGPASQRHFFHPRAKLGLVGHPQEHSRHGRCARVTGVSAVPQGLTGARAPELTLSADRFNRRYHYPYVFLNDVPFDGPSNTLVLSSERLATDSNLSGRRVQTAHLGDRVRPVHVRPRAQGALGRTGLDRRDQGGGGEATDGRGQGHLWR